MRALSDHKNSGIVTKDRACLIWACLAMAFVGIWLNITGRSGFFSSSDLDANRIAFYGMRIASLVVMALCAKLLTRFSKEASALGCSLLVVGALVRVIAYQTTGDFSDTMALMGQMLCGLGYMPCLIGICIGISASFAWPKLIPVILISLLLKQQVPSLLLSAPAKSHIWLLMGVLLMLAISMAAFWHAWSSSPAIKDQKETGSDSLCHLLALGCAADLTEYVFGIASGISIVSTGSSTATSASILTVTGRLIVALVYVTTAYIALVRCSNKPLNHRFIPAFSILALSTMLAEPLLLFNDPTGIGLITASLMGIYDFNQLLEWSLILLVLQANDARHVRIAVSILIPYDLLAILIGPIRLNPAEPAAMAFIVSFGLVMIVTVAIVLPFAFSGGDDKTSVEKTIEGYSNQPPRSSVAQQKLREAMNEQCLKVVREYSLTERESEVLLLLCQSNSRRSICEALCLSEGTVKTHIAHIYEKVGVNSRDALARKVFQEPGEGEQRPTRRSQATKTE